MCMKVRVTENTIQSNHSIQEEGSEQINQTSFSTNPIHQLTSELQELLMFTCQQKRINYSVLIIDLIITKNLLSKFPHMPPEAVSSGGIFMPVPVFNSQSCA